jgi:hypothetical protein
MTSDITLSVLQLHINQLLFRRVSGERHEATNTSTHVAGIRAEI